MSSRYLFPCSQCDHELELVATQAGQEIDCPDCGQTIEAPKLGVLRQLPVVEQTAAKKTLGRNTRLKRTLFATGLGLAVVLGGIGGALYKYASDMIVDPQLEKLFAQFDEEIEQMPTPQVLDIWSQMNFEEGLGEWREMGYARYRAQGTILQRVAYGVIGLAFVGLLMLIGSFMIKGP